MVTGQYHFPTDFVRGEDPPVAIEYVALDAGWAPESIWMLLWRYTIIFSQSLIDWALHT
jgi:hypothetical protein